MSPRMSVLTAVHDPDPDHLRDCLASVRAQTFTDLEHVVVDDGSTDVAVVEILRAAADSDRRIRLVRLPENRGIVAASSAALEVARGEFIALLDHDDLIEPDAVAAMVDALGDSADLAYSDHDLVWPDGRFGTPSYKPDFSPERLRSQNYITHFVAARRSTVLDAGGFVSGFDGAQDHDLLLRMSERADRIVHVPRILYHWRQAPTSVSRTGTKPWAFNAGVRAVQAHCDRSGIDADVVSTPHEGCYRLIRRVAGSPLVSIVVPTRGTSGRVWGATRCFVVEAVRSIIDSSTHQDLEFVVVHDDDTPPAVLRSLVAIGGERVRLVPFSGPFNFSAKVNLGATHASGDLLLFLNDDTELIEPSSIEVMVGHLQTAGVGMVGAKLLFADGTLQHGGHVYHHEIGHACFGWAGDSPGPWPLRPLAVERECSGVTAAAALVRRDVFDAVGGFTTDLPLNYNDVDFSLKIRALGQRIVWTPWAVWYHFESRTRSSVLLDDEYAFVNARWHYELNNDPYYNPNLAPDRFDWLERPWRSGAAPIDSRPSAPTRLMGRARGGSPG